MSPTTQLLPQGPYMLDSLREDDSDDEELWQGIWEEGLMVSRSDRDECCHHGLGIDPVL
jgi:hypothetical protein